MDKTHALAFVADGHTLITPECAREVCTSLGVPFSEDLVEHYAGQREANPDNHPKGLTLYKDEPTDGVYTLSLSEHVVLSMGLGVQSYIGRGSQARANAEAIQARLEEGR